MLAIMEALDEWKHYLMGAKHTVDIYTDHKNLTYFHLPQKLNCRQARWAAELQKFDYAIHPIPGKTNTWADFLSRHADYDQGKADNEGVVLLKGD